MTRGSARRARIKNAEDPAEIKKRSVVISGHRTSISLENVFWEALRTIAVEKGISVNQLVTDIDRQRTGNLSSAIRTFVLLDAIGD
ncbi:MAG: ribbon-helix-helix domain-containing protein [Alphaproteobacteria bacterium]|nr:ribbon-helix-helix domain-containing protein [Alphaproteobacteria bacterium]MBO6861693.1 ribbon-helix-helix domain-containing protein [Alphaproteobacteria bacterium]